MTAQGAAGRVQVAGAGRDADAADDGWRELVTPEGVDLRLKVGAYGERFAAPAARLPDPDRRADRPSASLAAGRRLGDQGRPGRSEALGGDLAAGRLRAAQLLLHLASRSGRAPRRPASGPWACGSIAADGGRLTADAVFARNAMRELEVFLPLTFLLGARRGRGRRPDHRWARSGAAVFVLFPLFNRDRRRLGDLAAGHHGGEGAEAGAAAGPGRHRARRGSGGFAFTAAQLDAYGVKELHVLEEVLRAGDRKALAEVAGRIRTKIGWEGPADIADRAFLNAYYAALRGRLESRMLFGHRRKDKFDVASLVEDRRQATRRRRRRGAGAARRRAPPSPTAPTRALATLKSGIKTMVCRNGRLPPAARRLALLNTPSSASMMIRMMK